MRLTKDQKQELTAAAARGYLQRQGNVKLHLAWLERCAALKVPFVEMTADYNARCCRVDVLMPRAQRLSDAQIAALTNIIRGIGCEDFIVNTLGAVAHKLSLDDAVMIAETAAAIIGTTETRSRNSLGENDFSSRPK